MRPFVDYLASMQIHDHAGVSLNKNDKFEHVHMQKIQHFKERHSFPSVIAAW